MRGRSLQERYEEITNQEEILQRMERQGQGLGVEEELTTSPQPRSTLDPSNIGPDLHSPHVPTQLSPQTQASPSPTRDPAEQIQILKKKLREKEKLILKLEERVSVEYLPYDAACQKVQDLTEENTKLLTLIGQYETSF